MSQAIIWILVWLVVIALIIWYCRRPGCGTSCGTSCGSTTTPEKPQPLKSEETSDSSQTVDSEGAKPATLEGPEGNADDLKKISGVGPKLEQTLNDLGIFHYSQIAGFTDENIIWVDNNLNFKGRIQRDNWVEQAKELSKGG